MKFYGYANKELEGGLLELKEVTVSGKPEALLAMASFLTNCANKLNSNDNANFEHEHLADCDSSIANDSPEFIVVNPSM